MEKQTKRHRWSSSRRTSNVFLKLKTGKLKKLVIVFLFLGGGFFCGHLLLSMKGYSDIEDDIPELSDSSDVTYNPELDNLDNRKLKENINIEARKEHVPPSERPGKSIKKDMSVQFREYVPRLLLINCGGTFPTTVQLFRQTYPDSDKYIIFTFLPDMSFSDLYIGLNNHTLYTPVQVYDKNDTVQYTYNKFGSSMPSVDLIPTIDIGKWLIDNTHQDDYVIFKIDIYDKDIEKEIIKRIVSLNGLEWIDKFYTTSKLKDMSDFYNKTFAIHHMSFHIWDNEKKTYSDFDALHVPRIPPDYGRIVLECKDKKNAEKFALSLHADQSTVHLKQTMKALLRYANGRKQPISLFLPKDFMEENIVLFGEVLHLFTTGLYLKTKMTSELNSEEGCFHVLRNEAIEADRYFEKAGNSLLQYIAVVNEGNFSNYQKCIKLLVKKRHVSVFQNFRDITYFGGYVLDGRKITSGMLKLEDEQHLSIDISQRHSDILTLYMIKRFEPWIFSIDQCIKT